MPCDSTPRILPTLMVNGSFSPGLSGSEAPGRISGTLSPALKFCAPQTICRSPLPSLTRQSESLSALGCLSRVMTWRHDDAVEGGGDFLHAFDFEAEHGQPLGNSSGDQLKSTYCLSQLRVTFIGGDVAKSQSHFKAAKRPDVRLNGRRFPNRPGVIHH